MTPYRVISYGGGVQSTAMIVLATQGIIDYTEAVMANVGDDSEHPDTMRFVRDTMIPWAAERGVKVHIIERRKRDGTVETLWDLMMKEGSRSLPIPIRMNDTGAPTNRACTEDFKVKPLIKWNRQHGATKDNPAICAIGISLDEFQRMRDSNTPYQKLDYPLIELRLNRTDCKKIIADAGLPVPPKSSCFFCPFHDMGTWQRLYSEHPALFAKSVELERTLNGRRLALGRSPVWLTRHRVPLDAVVTGDHENQMELMPDDGFSCGPFVCEHPTDKVAP